MIRVIFSLSLVLAIFANATMSVAANDDLPITSDLIHEELLRLFAQAQLTANPDVDIKVEPMTTSHANNTKPSHPPLNITVTMAADQPDTLIRDARQRIARLVMTRGYRFSTSIDDPSLKSTAPSRYVFDGVDPRPVALIRVVVKPEAFINHPAEMLQKYGIFVALVSSAIFCMILFVYLIARLKGLRRSQHSVQVQLDDKNSAPAYSTPTNSPVVNSTTLATKKHPLNLASLPPLIADSRKATPKVAQSPTPQNQPSSKGGLTLANLKNRPKTPVLAQQQRRLVKQKPQAPVSKIDLGPWSINGK